MFHGPFYVFLSTVVAADEISLNDAKSFCLRIALFESRTCERRRAVLLFRLIDIPLRNSYWTV